MLLFSGNKRRKEASPPRLSRTRSKNKAKGRGVEEGWVYNVTHNPSLPHELRAEGRRRCTAKNINLLAQKGSPAVILSVGPGERGKRGTQREVWMKRVQRVCLAVRRKLCENGRERREEGSVGVETASRTRGFFFSWLLFGAFFLFSLFHSCSVLFCSFFFCFFAHLFLLLSRRERGGNRHGGRVE